MGALPKVCSGGYKDMDTIIMNVRNGKQITFNGYDLETVTQQISLEIAKHDPNFMNGIQTEIKNNSKQYGIDRNKICFDTKEREKIETIAAQRESQKQQEDLMEMISQTNDVNSQYSNHTKIGI